MTRCFVLVSVLVLAGCDSLQETDPPWVQIGATALFDYTPGPDSLRIFLASSNGGGEHRAADVQAAAIEMRVVASPRWRWTDRHVAWTESPPEGAAWASYEARASFPLDDDDVTVRDDGLGVVVSVDCSGGLLGGARRRLTFTRVPNRVRPIEAYSNCQHTHSLSPRTYSAFGPEEVTVPHGTFSTIRVERATAAGTVLEWWSWEVGLVRLDVLNETGELRGRFVRSATG